MAVYLESFFPQDLVQADRIQWDNAKIINKDIKSKGET